uniref:Immunoglobulin superfamily member 10 n=1 Tax=Sander lucioperca TaxID=283035 RepID=A0A8C9ZXF3_SANLU
MTLRSTVKRQEHQSQRSPGVYQTVELSTALFSLMPMHLHITVVTAAPRIRPTSQTYARVKPGGNVRFDCEAFGEPKPKILWLLPTNDVIAASNELYLMHVNGSLDIRDVKLINAGEYVCMARNPAGENRKVYNILRRPIFKNPYNERIVSQIGKTTVLNCSADGYPIPEITWTLPNGTRFTGGHHLVKNGTLVIYNPRKEDAGKYRCGAKNLMGYIEKLIILDVGQKPYILTRPRGIIRSVSGEPLFLHCLSDGSPTPRIYWTIPGGHTLTRPQVLGRYQLLENGTLVVQDTTLHDRGNYICRARSDAGEAVLAVPVIIIAYPPRITTGPPPSVRAVTGTPIQLNCAAIGIPKPEISWELPDRSVLSAAEQGRPMGSELLHPQGTLIIQRPTASDSGTYKCLAKNHLGTDSKLIERNKKKAPKRL